MTDIRALTSRLIASPVSSKVLSDDGLALVYYPSDGLSQSLVAAGRLGRYPARIEELYIMAAIRDCLRQAEKNDDLTYRTRLDHPGGFHVVEFEWPVRPNQDTAELPALVAAPASVPAAQPVTVYLACYTGVEDGRYDVHSAGVSTHLRDAANFGRRSGKEGWRLVETQIYPKSRPIRYGMKLPSI